MTFARNRDIVIAGGDELPDRNLSIRVDEELFRKIKVKIAMDDKTLKEYLLDLILKDLETKE